MNMAQRAEDIDYEPEVLKFTQIWDEMNQTTKQKPQKGSSQQASKLKNQEVNRNKNQAQKKDANKEKSREKAPQPSKEVARAPKKQTVLSEKNVTRNPKQNPQMVVEVVTNPQGYYQDSLKNQKNNVDKEHLIQTALNPSGITEISSLRKALQQKDYELSLLRVSNTRNEDRIHALQKQIAQKQERIFQLQARQRQLLYRNQALTGSQKIFDYGKVEYQNFKNDTRRLLKMLQTTNQYQQFSNLALDDNGVRFLNEVNKKIKSAIDSKEKSTLHFCTCNKEFIPQSGFWVPEKVYNYGKEFVKERNGQLTQAQLELLLYDLNKIWREREKRIINTLSSQKAKEVDQLKRKLAQKSSSARQ